MISPPTQENIGLDNIFSSEKSKQGFSSELSKLIQNFDKLNEQEKDLETYLTKHNNQNNSNKKW